MSLFSLILFLLMLTVLIFVHELGHFLAAKWTGMKVEEFSIGFFNPKLFSKKIGDTEYAIRAFLLGGYVKILGENDPEGEALQNPRAFSNRPWWQQAVVLVAGVFMNAVLAYVLFVIISYGTTTVEATDPLYVKRVTNTRMMIADVLPDSPASKAGISSGATLLELKAGGVKDTLALSSTTVAFIEKHQNDSVVITYQNPGTEKPASTTLALVYGLVPEKKALGISLERVGDIKVGFGESFVLGAKQFSRFTLLTLSGLYDLVRNAFHGQNVIASLSGPIGIASLVGQAQRIGFESVLLLAAFLSLNLAVLNILPFPALDGGQLLKVTIEAVLRRKLSHEYNAWINAIGFFFLIGLLLIVSIHDIFKLFHS